MVNQAFRIKIAYREKEENTRDRSVPDGSDNDLHDNGFSIFALICLQEVWSVKTLGKEVRSKVDILFTGFSD